MFDEPPVGERAVEDGALDQGVGQVECELEVVVVAGPVPGVQEHLTDACGSAAASVVVPEAGVEAGGQAGGADAVQAPAVPRERRLTRDVLDAGAIEGEEEQ